MAPDPARSAATRSVEPARLTSPEPLTSTFTTGAVPSKSMCTRAGQPQRDGARLVDRKHRESPGAGQVRAGHARHLARMTWGPGRCAGEMWIRRDQQRGADDARLDQRQEVRIDVDGDRKSVALFDANIERTLAIDVEKAVDAAGLDRGLTIAMSRRVASGEGEDQGKAEGGVAHGRKPRGGKGCGSLCPSVPARQWFVQTDRALPRGAARSIKATSAPAARPACR